MAPLLPRPFCEPIPRCADVARRTATEEPGHEVRGADLQQPGRLGQTARQGGRPGDQGPQRPHRRAHRVGRVPQHLPAGRGRHRPDGGPPRRGAGGHRRTLRGVQGGPGQPLGDRRGRGRAGSRDRRDPHPLRHGGGATADGRARHGDVSGATQVEELLRELAPQVTGTLLRRYGQFDLCEDAVQEALLAASVQWPEAGIPEPPRGWLVTVAWRRLTDQVRGESARRRREETIAARSPADERVTPGPEADLPAANDDALTLLFLCCHPALSPPSQVALTLRAVGGLTTAQVARAFLVPEATMAQRISRAKQRIKAAGARFAMPPPAERAERLRVVLQVLYLIFNEGYAASSGPPLQRRALTSGAIRLARELHRLLPEDGEVAGLLALMLLTDARRPARTRPDGSLVPLAH